MGTLEQRSMARRRKGDIQKIVLTCIKTAGLISVALLAPNALKFLKFDTSNGKAIINRARARLLKAGLLARNASGYLTLTRKGLAKLTRLEARDYKLKEPKRWDGKWRVLIFDIKEERKPTREKIRRTLFSIGFRRLQDSVWVYPYDCEDLVALLKVDLKIGKDLRYLIVEEMEGDSNLKKEFGLR